MRPGAFLSQLGVGGAGGNALHEPGHILPQVAERLHALGILLHLTGAHAVNHVPVERAHQRLLVVGNVLVEAVERGAGAPAASHGNGGTRLVGQLGTCRIVETVKQRAESTIRPGEVGGAADDNAANLIELVVDVVVKLVVHAAAAGLEAGPAADTALHRCCANLHNLCFHPCGIHGFGNHGKSLECVTICMRTTIDEKSFHALYSNTEMIRPQGNNAQTKRGIDRAGACVI